MRYVLLLILIVAAPVGGLAFVLTVCVADHSAITKLYTDHMRTAFFAAFLSLGGFLLSLKTFIVVKMKENVYDTKSYSDELVVRKLSEPGVRRYAELRNLSELLFASILSCFVTSVAQFSVGLVESFWAAVACTCLAIASVVLLLIALFVTRRNLHSMFERCEHDAECADSQKTPYKTTADQACGENAARGSG